MSNDVLKLNLILEESNVNINALAYKFEINAKYRARYAKYFIHDEKYKQIFTKGWTKSTDNIQVKYYYDDENDLDCMNFDIADAGEQEIESKNIINFKLKTDEEGKAIQYKYCVNNLFNTYIDENGEDKTVQVPRFGIYPVLEGYVPFMFETFNYKDPDDFPIKNYPKNGSQTTIKNFFKIEKNTFEKQVLKKNSQVIWYIDTSVLSKDLEQNVSSTNNANESTLSIKTTNIADSGSLQTMNSYTPSITPQNTT